LFATDARTSLDARIDLVWRHADVKLLSSYDRGMGGHHSWTALRKILTLAEGMRGELRGWRPQSSSSCFYALRRAIELAGSESAVNRRTDPPFPSW
jgi:hypothetical protein